MMAHLPELDVVSHNVYVGQSPRSVRTNLERLVIDLDHPHAIALQEAWRFSGTIAGYDRVPLASPPDHAEDRNCVLLVRDDVTIVRPREVDVEGGDWYGLEHRRWHPPRRFNGATLETPDGVRWDVLVVHRVAWNLTANAHPYRLEDRALVEWVDSRLERHPTRTVALVGDWNSRRGDPRRTFGVVGLAKRLEAIPAVKGVDGALVVNAGTRGLRKLAGRYGSDAHRPVTLTLVKTGDNRP